MRRAAILILASCGLLTGFTDLPASQAAESARDAAIEGRWAVRLEGKPVQILELRHDPAAVGGWSGSFTTAQLMMTEEHSFSNVQQGSGNPSPITSAQWTDGGTLAFTVKGHGDRYTFEVAGDGTALLGWEGIRVKPLVLDRARADEVIPADWEAGKVYATEDGHR